MTRGLLRTMAILLLLIAGVTFSFCPTVVAALSEPQAVDSCCGSERSEPERPTPAGDCLPTECGCVTCVVVIPSTLGVELGLFAPGDSRTHATALKPPAVYLSGIDYPPEAV